MSGKKNGNGYVKKNECNTDIIPSGYQNLL